MPRGVNTQDEGCIQGRNVVNANSSNIVAPGIVTDGLVLHLDAGNYQSYPIAGTTWYDLSGYRNNGTLTNGPTYARDGGGAIVFDGVNDYVGCGNAINLKITVGTISAWFKASDGNTGYNGIIAKENAWGLFVTDDILITYDWGNVASRSTGIDVGNSNWYHVAMTFTETVGSPSDNAIIYLNGSNVLLTTVKNPQFLPSFEVRLGENGNNGQFLSGSIAQASVYNKVLSSIEVAQNFNATRARFNI